MSSATRAYKAIVDHLNAHNFKFTQDDENLVIKFTVQGEDLPQPTVVRVDPNRDIVQFVSPLPGNFPSDKLVDAALAVAAANHGMIEGGFQLDLEDGSIHFNASQSFAGTELNDEVINYLFSLVFQVTDMYNDKFFMLSKGMITLEQLIDSL